MTWLSDGSEPVRVAYSVSKAAEPSAVKRNRAKRRLRAVMRTLAPELLPGSYVVSIRGVTGPLNFSDLTSAVRDSLSALAALHPGSARAL